MLYSTGLWYFCAEMCKPLLMPSSGLFSHIALHKKVLYAGGEDGTLSQLTVKGDHALITAMQTIGSSVTSLSFNPSHHKLAVSCSSVSCRFLTVLLWPPCVADADIIFLPCGFFLLLSFLFLA